MEKFGFGFIVESFEFGKNFFNVVINSLWYVDLFIDCFYSRGLFYFFLFEYLVGFNDLFKLKYRKLEMDRVSLFVNV